MRPHSFIECLWLLASLPLVLSQDSISYDLNTYGQGDAAGTPFQSYKSNTNVKPPQMQINSNGSGLAEGYVFLGINGEPTSGQNWPAIFDFSTDRMGTLVWTGNYTEPFDFKTQTYKGQPVLTFWSGELLNGYGRGSFYILNQSYAEIAHFQVNRFGENMGDIHEFEITASDTAMIAIYHAIPFDLSASGGIQDGWLFENTIQEINIETGALVFEWNASTHVGINESYNSLPEDVGRTQDAPWDYFHINSIEKDRNGDYIVSARHDARWLNDDQTRMTIFDNGPTDSVQYSRGLLLDVNQDAKTVKLIREFTNGAKTFAMFEGSLQAVDPSNESTNFIVGYGSQPYFAELNSNGDILLDVQFGKTNAVNCYRAFKQPWQGKPSTKPDLLWDKEGNRAYFSWNGATDVETWEVYTANASDSKSWANITSARRTGFETTIDLSNMQVETFVRGKAVNSTGGALAWSQASDGNRLYDAPDEVQESTNPSSTTSRSQPSSTSSRSQPSSTSAAPTSSSSAAAARQTQGAMQQAYGAAVVAVGALVLI
ncbi:hypothetical protein IQ07DRAFT_498982 [Pyrenochaeta sp. DS3sAY3a]|nr:hypothetical protein IQ07DRAFT_498982 [Pyrenochaeta sp. DS3sAY3a]